MAGDCDHSTAAQRQPTVLMLLSNAYDPDPRVRQEALALISMGCRVRILAWDRDLKAPPFECLEGVEIERVFLGSKHGRGSTQLFYYAVLFLKILRRAWAIRFDAIHCHDLDTLPPGFLLGKLKGKPIVYDAHESFPDMLRGSVHPVICGALVRLENVLIRRINLLITVGEKLRRHFVERGSRHSVVVGNWKKIEEYSRTEEQNHQVRQRLGIPDSATTVVCITQLLGDRKLDELLDAVDECKDIYLIIGGKGVLEKQIRERAARNPRIVFVGFVRGSEIPAYTCAADIVYYGFDPENPNARFSAPNKLFEALAAGRPLITGNFGEIADVVREAGCGIVLRSYSVEEIRSAFELMGRGNKREEMAENARVYGRMSMNWHKAEAVLHRAYSALLRVPLQLPGSEQSYAATHQREVATSVEGR